MKTDIEKVFYYHGSGNPIGGHITHPMEAVLEQHASTSIPQAGGQASARIEGFNLNNLIRCEAAYSHTIGSRQKSSGNWTTLITSVVEGVNLFDIVTADRLVANIALEHRKDSYYPKCSFTGSQFENLRVSGNVITPEVDLNILTSRRPYKREENDSTSAKDEELNNPKGITFDFPPTAWPNVQSFVDRAVGQASEILEKDPPPFIRQRFDWIANPAERQKRGYVLCSLVDNVKGVADGSHFGHVVDVPDLGRLFLGEVLVDHLGFKLTMMRAEFGCQADGTVSMASGSGDGAPMP